MNTSTSAVLLYAIVGAAVLIYLPFLIVGYARAQIGPEALATPRDKFDKLPAYAQRATWAHENSFEAFMIFAAAALMAYATGVDSTWATGAAITFLIARSLYSVFYILNIAPARSLMFATGSICDFILFGLSLINVNTLI